MFEYYDSDEDIYWGPATTRLAKKDVLRKYAVESVRQFHNIRSEETRRVPSWPGPSTMEQPNIIESTSLPQNIPDSTVEIIKETSVIEISSDSSLDDDTFNSSLMTLQKDIKTNSEVNINEIEDFAEISLENGDENHSEERLLDDTTIEEDVVSKCSSENTFLLKVQEIIVVKNRITEEESNFHDTSDDNLNVENESGFKEDSCEKPNINKTEDITEELNIAEDFVNNLSQQNEFLDVIEENIEKVIENISIVENNEVENQIKDDLSLEEVEIENHPNVKDMINNYEHLNIEKNVSNNLDINEQTENTQSLLKECLEDSIITMSLSNNLIVDGYVSDNQYEEKSSSGSVDFDNTLDFMEQMLKDAAGLKIKEQEETLEQIIVPEVPKVTPIKTSIPTHPNFQTRSIPRPVNNPLRSITPNLKIRAMTPNVKTSGKDKYKYIQSPVGTYIKNSGTTPMLRKLPNSQPNKENQNLPISSKLHLPDQPDCEFPIVKYKAAKNQIVIEQEGFKLPPNITSMIPIKPTATAHKKRTGLKKVPSELDEDNVSIQSNSSLNMTQDVSIRERKNVFIQ